MSSPNDAPQKVVCPFAFIVGAIPPLTQLGKCLCGIAANFASVPFSYWVEVLAFPFYVVTGRDNFEAIAASFPDVLVEFGYFVKRLRTSHLHRSEDSLFFFFQVSRYLAEVIVDFKRDPATFAVHSSVPFGSVSRPPGCVQDERFQILARPLHDTYWFLIPLPNPEIVVDPHAMPNHRLNEQA